MNPILRALGEFGFEAYHAQPARQRDEAQEFWFIKTHPNKPM